METGSARDLLPIVADSQPTPVERSRIRAIAFHLLRIAMIVAIVVLIRLQHIKYADQQSADFAKPVAIDQLAKFFPDATRLSEQKSPRDPVAVFDAEDNELGYFVQTSPLSDHIVGYSGPTNTLIAFDKDSRVLGIEILSTRDTPEHMADVKRDEFFMTALQGKTWSDVKSSTDVDAVSGATLTSLAILEGINHRLGGNKPSLRFPEGVEVAEVKEWFPTATSLQPSTTSATMLDVLSAEDKPLGKVTRSSPATDREMGYQGPTDTLIAFDIDNRIVVGLQVLKSYDNEPYVGYVREDKYFRDSFNGLTVQELSKIDIAEMRVEGVSGATMTSMAVAYGLPQAAEAALEPAPITQRRIVIAMRDVGTFVVLAAALVLCFTRLRGYRSVRIAFQLVLVGYFGFVNGDMLSQALLVGWAQSGVPWRLAPGLLAVVAASFIVPMSTKKQLYCHHVCPFGAAQHLMRNRLQSKLPWPRFLVKLRRPEPLVLVAIVLLLAMFRGPLNFATVEPFDAFFLFKGAAVASIVIAAVGLAWSIFVPMAYCRFGCPTGALLSYVRRNARSDRFSIRDAIAATTLLIAACIHWVL